jgi:hypothetical protein
MPFLLLIFVNLFACIFFQGTLNTSHKNIFTCVVLKKNQLVRCRFFKSHFGFQSLHLLGSHNWLGKDDIFCLRYMPFLETNYNSVHYSKLLNIGWEPTIHECKDFKIFKNCLVVIVCFPPFSLKYWRHWLACTLYNVPVHIYGYGPLHN